MTASNTPTIIVETIQLILAPVVMITACALLLNSLGARYSGLSNRLQTLAKDRLTLLDNAAQSKISPIQ